jgi:hypothetical protein
LISPLPTTLKVWFALPEKVAVVDPPPVVPMMLTEPSFSKYWFAPAVVLPPVIVQLVVALPAVKLLVPFTKRLPWLISVSVLTKTAPAVFVMVQVLVPVPVA